MLERFNWVLFPRRTAFYAEGGFAYVVGAVDKTMIKLPSCIQNMQKEK